MSDKTIELNRRRVLGGMITIGGAAAAAGAGTFALFSDTEQSSGNSITAGTLNLELNPNNGGASTAISFTDIAPGDTGTIAIELGNSGSINGDLTSVNIGSVSGGTFSSALVSDSEGTDPEFEASPGTDGELDTNLTIGAFVEPSGAFTGSVGTSQNSTTTRSGSETNIVSSGTKLNNALGSNSVTEQLNPTDQKYFVLNYTLPSGTTNEVQGDGVEFDVQFLLDQA